MGKTTYNPDYTLAGTSKIPPFKADPVVEANPPASEGLEAPEITQVDIPPAVELPAVRLEVFARVHGAKWDQFAGFRAWATQQKLAPRSVPEWRAEFLKFQKKPTK